ncbi:hypothetical protein F5Y09DRAFT_302833 [Xylaria sp. FL1042]|nr:hypothetical protein F5Y09DRAFT_302833 [Xylaria sp. FL1042]
MDPFVNGCRGSAGAIRREAQRRLDDLVSTPWHTGTKVTEDVARVRHQIDILKASNALSSAELLDVAHSCDVCDASALPKSIHDACATCIHDAALGTTHKSCPVSLSMGLMRNLEEKKLKMQTIMDQILNRSALIRKLEDHLKTYDNITKSLNIVAPEDKMEYYYKINADSGVNLVINERKNSSLKNETRFTMADLMDPEILVPPPTPILAPVSVRPTRPPTSLFSPLRPRKAAPRNILEAEEGEVNPFPKLKPQILQIWDSEEERVRSLREHVGPLAPLNSDYVPLVFNHGVQYKPPRLSSAPCSPTSYPTNYSRMVVFSKLHRKTTWEEILAVVRGGPILRATRADPTTWFVYFVRERDAKAYAGSARNRHTVVHGKIVSVHLTPTPSYPIRAALMQDIMQRGVTRCLGFPRYDAAFGRMLETCLLRQKIGEFAVTKPSGAEMPTPILPTTVVTGVADAITVTTPTSTSSANATAASTVARRDDEEKEEWVVLENEDGTARFTKVEKQKQTQTPELQQEQEQQPTSPKMDTTLLAFRDIVHAQAAYRIVCAEFPNCGVYYAQDPCAGPLSELA